MARYQIEIYDNKGRLVSRHIENYSSEVGRWKQNVKLDKKDGNKSTYRSKPTRNNINRKVTSYTSFSKDGSKVKATLIQRNRTKRGRKRK